MNCAKKMIVRRHNPEDRSGRAMIVKLPDNVIESPIALKDQFFDLRGLSAYSALSVSTIRTDIRSNGFPAYEVFGKILVRRSEFDRWVSGYRIRKEQDLDNIVNGVFREIGASGRRSKTGTT